jgi:Tripartite tricarboxylate transporter family receptor
MRPKAASPRLPITAPDASRAVASVPRRYPLRPSFAFRWRSCFSISVALAQNIAQISQAIGDLLNGTNHFMFITTLPVVELIANGNLRALAVTGSKRIAALADVPTVTEQGFPNLTVEDWVGFAVKSGTPNDVVVRLNEAINKALGKPKVREAFARVGAEPAGGTPLESVTS